MGMSCCCDQLANQTRVNSTCPSCCTFLYHCVGVADVLLRIGLLVVVECHLANPLVPWMVILAVCCMFLFRHFLVCPFLDHLRVLFQTAWALPVGTSVVVVALRTASCALQEEVHLHTLVPLVLRCTLSAVQPAVIVVVASTVVEVRTA